MVRLVFRPYTRLGRSICTSESLRSSTRVSPGFDLVRHRSPSFGSQRVGSVSVRSALSRRSNATRMRPLCSRRDLRSRHVHHGRSLLSLRLAGFVFSRRLAHMLDSLVRVSRRVEWDPTSTSLLYSPLPRVREESDRSRPSGRTACASRAETGESGRDHHSPNPTGTAPRLSATQPVAESY